MDKLEGQTESMQATLDMLVVAVLGKECNKREPTHGVGSPNLGLIPPIGQNFFIKEK